MTSPTSARRISKHNRTVRFYFQHHRRCGVECQLFVERTQIRALSNEHFVPFAARRAGIQTVFRPFARSNE